MSGIETVSAHGTECGGIRLLEAAPIPRDRRHRALLLGQDGDGAAEAVGDCLERGKAEARSHAARLVLRVGEGELRQDVAGGALEVHALAAGHRPDDVAHRPGEVGGVDVHVVARRHGMAAETDERRDHRLVRAPRLQHRDLVVHELVGVPAEDRAAVVAPGRALAAVDGEVGVRLTPDDPRRLEPLDRQPADGDDLVVDHAREGCDRFRQVVVDVSVHGAVRDAAGRREVGVAPVEQDAGRCGAGRGGDAPDQRADLRLDDPDDVDAAEDDPRPVTLERDRADLER